MENPLEQYVLNILKETGYDKLSEGDQRLYLLQFTAEAERRLGIAVLPLLKEDQAQKFTEMMEDEKTTPDQWWKFWNQAVPNFEEVLKETLKNFAEEVKQAFVK